MKRRSKATFYRNVKRGSATCFTLSQENCNNSKYDCINDNVLITKNNTDFQCNNTSNKTEDCFNTDCFNVSHDLYRQNASDRWVDTSAPHGKVRKFL